MTKQISQKGEADGLDFNAMSDVLVRVRAPESGDAAVYMIGVIDGLRCEIARLRATVEPREDPLAVAVRAYLAKSERIHNEGMGSVLSDIDAMRAALNRSGDSNG